jgi:glycogen operon protein
MSAFFDLIQQDPVISQVKLIAEPWDIGEGGYQVGNFPPLWSEWNGKYRDAVRDYWRGEPRTLGEMGYRLTGSSDLYENSARRPHASINFVTAHDGFTLADLVTYEQKHNEANGEGDIAGANDNRSFNFGVEGPTDDEGVIHARRQQQRNLLATLLLSQGVPMILGGDEIGRTQGGNNNAYAQDNEISWYDWANADAGLLAFTQGLIALRKAHPVFRRRRWFQGRQIHGEQMTDIAWFQPDGQLMSEEHWNEASSRALGLYLDGENLGVDQRGEQITDSTFYLLLNAAPDEIGFRLPAETWGEAWRLVFDTTSGEPPRLKVEASAESLLPTGSVDHRADLQHDQEIKLVGRSVTLLERVS